MDAVPEIGAPLIPFPPLRVDWLFGPLRLHLSPDSKLLRQKMPEIPRPTRRYANDKIRDLLRENVFEKPVDWRLWDDRTASRLNTWGCGIRMKSAPVTSHFILFGSAQICLQTPSDTHTQSHTLLVTAEAQGRRECQLITQSTGSLVFMISLNQRFKWARRRTYSIERWLRPRSTRWETLLVRVVVHSWRGGAGTHPWRHIILTSPRNHIVTDPHIRLFRGAIWPSGLSGQDLSSTLISCRVISLRSAWQVINKSGEQPQTN